MTISSFDRTPRFAADAAVNTTTTPADFTANSAAGADFAAAEKKSITVWARLGLSASLAIVTIFTMAVTTPHDPIAAAQPAPSTDTPRETDPAEAEGQPSVAELLRMLGEPDAQRWQRIEQAIIARRHDPQLRAGLATAAGQEESVGAVRATRLVRLFERAFDSRLDRDLPNLFSDYHSSDPDRRAAAILALWRDRSPQAAELIRDRAADSREYVEVRRFALLSLGAFPATAATVDLVRRLAHLDDAQLAPSALWVLAHFDRMARRDARRQRQLGAGPLGMRAFPSGSAEPLAESLAGPIAQQWWDSRDGWRRETAWRYFARFPATLTRSRILHALIGPNGERDPAVRAVIAEVAPLSPEWPAAPSERYRAILPVAEQLALEPTASREHLQRALHRLIDGPMAARMAVDDALPLVARLHLPESFWEAAAVYERPALLGMASASDARLIRRARRALAHVGGGAGLCARLDVGDWIGGPTQPLRDVFAQLSRRTGIEFAAAPGSALIDDLDVPGWLRGGSVYDLLAAIGERLDLRFAFDGYRLRAIHAGFDIGGERWLPQVAVSRELNDRYNRLRVPPLPENFGGARHDLDDVMRVCAEILDAPVIYSAGVAALGIRDREAPQLAAGKPLATALPAVLETLSGGLRTMWRGRSLWIVTGDEVTAYEALDRYRIRPTPSALDRLAALPALNRRPVVAECLALLPDAVVPAVAEPWIAVATAQIERDRVANAHSARMAMAVGALRAFVSHPSAVMAALEALAHPHPFVRTAARNVLGALPVDRLWQTVAPQIVRLPVGGRLELVSLLERSATSERLTRLLAWFIERAVTLDLAPHMAHDPTADPLGAAVDAVLIERGFPLDFIGLSFVRLSGQTGATLPLRELPLGAPIRFDFEFAAPDWFAAALQIVSGRTIATGLESRRLWRPTGPFATAQVSLAQPGAPLGTAISTALQDLARRALGPPPLLLEARWFPGATIDGRRFAAEIVIDSVGVRNEMELFAVYLSVLAEFDWTGRDWRRRESALRDLPLSADIEDRVAERVAVIHAQIARAAWMLTVSAGVEITAQTVPNAPPVALQRFQHLRAELSAPDRLWWQRVAGTLRQIEARTASAPNVELARLGLRLRTLADLPVPSFYSPYTHHLADPDWLNPDRTGLIWSPR